MAMLKEIPSNEEIESLIGVDRFKVWKDISKQIEALYDMELLHNDGGKRWTYEYKYRRASKTLCALYAKEDCFGFMIIFGKNERDKFEAIRSSLSESVIKTYDEAAVYHDGKWVMFDENITLEDVRKLLLIKRKPNKK